jgi:hypothetical protein
MQKIITTLVIAFTILLPTVYSDKLKSDKMFYLGPYNQEILPVPVELDFEGKTGKTYHIEELNEKDKIIKTYEIVKYDANKNIFIPFPLPQNKLWQKGKARRFVIKESTKELKSEGFDIKEDKSLLTLKNPYYAITILEPGHAGSDSANHLIESILFPDIKKSFNPSMLRSDLPYNDKEFIWNLTPTLAMYETYNNKQIVVCRYSGEYRNGKESIPDLTWNAEWTFYAKLPLIKIKLTRENPKNLKFKFGRIFQLYFNPQDMPFKNKILSERGRYKRGTYCGLAGNKCLLAWLNPSPKTSSLGYLCKTWGYLCADWEGSNLALNTVEDVREYYLLITPNANLKDKLKEYSNSLKIMQNSQWEIKIKQLFK